jgi:hypothetical protein
MKEFHLISFIYEIVFANYRLGFLYKIKILVICSFTVESIAITPFASQNDQGSGKFI